MKYLIFLISALLTAGCIVNKIEDYEESFTVANPNYGLSEDPNNPGTFYRVYDTVIITKRTVSNGKKGRITYKIKLKK